MSFTSVKALTGLQPGYSTYIIVFHDGPPGQSEEIIKTISSIIQSPYGRIKYVYNIINGVAAVMSDDLQDEILAIQGVKYLEKDDFVYASLDNAAIKIGADIVWQKGGSGKGVNVCVIDTGIDSGHPDLSGNKVAGWIDYVQGYLTPYDDHGHGTHCSGTIAGTGAASGGRYKGIAHNSTLLIAKALDYQGVGYDSDVIKAIDWASQNDADIISLSLGGDHVRSMDEAVSNAINKGITVVCAAGNYGPGTETIQCPGDNPDAITVGATDRMDVLASFSSRGPTYDGRTKPDITAMGVGLVAAKANPTTTYYISMSGTSMATPMVAGIAALLLEKNPELSPNEIKNILTSTAVRLSPTIPNNETGYGRVNVSAAYDSIILSPGSEVISYSMPQDMYARDTGTVTITLKNTGTVNWTENIQMRLGAVDDYSGDAASFGDVRILLPPGTVIRTGESYSFNFTITAPDHDGLYTLRYRMVWDGHEWFGPTISSEVAVMPRSFPLDAVVITNTIPAGMETGKQYAVTLTVKNNGSLSWSESSLVRLGGIGDFSGDSAKFGVVRVPIQAETVVEPGSEYTFTFMMTAPGTPGTYRPMFRVVKDGEAWFGTTLIKTISVTGQTLPLPDSTLISNAIQSTMVRNDTAVAWIIMQNTGNVEWNETTRFRLGAVGDYVGDAYLFGPVRVYIPPGTTVPPGQQYAFNFTIKAPPGPGTYHPAWQMVWEGQRWFGQVSDKTIMVI